MISGRNKRASLHVINVGEFKQTYGKYYFLLWFYCGIIAGTFLINFFCENFYESLGVYSSFFLDINKNISVPRASLFFYVIKKMAMEIGVLLVLINSKLKEISTRIFVCYKGVTVSLLVSAYVMKYGMSGIIIYLITIFPHFIPYIYMIIYILKMGDKQNRLRNILIVVILFFITAFVEAYINSGLLELL